MKQLPRLELIEMFDKYVDDSYPAIEVCGYEYLTSEMLKLDIKSYEFEFEKWKRECEVEEE